MYTDYFSAFRGGSIRGGRNWIKVDDVKSNDGINSIVVIGTLQLILPMIICKYSGCGAVGSALDWGSRGRKFKSCHSDFFTTEE